MLIVSVGNVGMCTFRLFFYYVFSACGSIILDIWICDYIVSAFLVVAFVAAIHAATSTNLLPYKLGIITCLLTSCW